MELVRRGNAWLAREWGPTDPLTGKRYKISASGRTRAEARGRLEARRSTSVVVGSSGPASPTLRQLVTQWRSVAGHGPRTAETTSLALSRVPDALLDTRLDAIGTHALERLYRSLLSGEGRERPLAPATVRRLHGVLRAAYGAGERWGWITDNVARRVQSPAASPRVLEIPDVRAVKAAVTQATSEDPTWGLFLRILATTGLRRGEAVGLAWEHIDFDHGLLRIRRSVTPTSGGPIITACKTASSRRDVPIDDITLAGLSAQRERVAVSAAELGAVVQRGWAVWPAVKAAEWGPTPISPTTVGCRWNRERSRLGLSGVRIHDLRHFAATQMLAAGVDPVTVAGAWASQCVRVRMNRFEVTDGLSKA